MDVFLIRHAQALDAAGDVEDAHRPLTARGRRDAHKLGKRLQKAGVELSALIASPLVRAVETAELIAVGLELDAALEVAPELSPARDPEQVIEELLLPRADLPSVALVGHNPLLSDLLELLLKAPAPSLSKATAVRLRYDGPDTPARFKWVLRADLDEPSKDLADAG